MTAIAMSPYRHIAISPMSDHSGLSCMGLWHFSNPPFVSSPAPPLAHPPSHFDFNQNPTPTPTSTSISCPENPLHVVSAPRICFECCMQPILPGLANGQSTGLGLSVLTDRSDRAQTSHETRLSAFGSGFKTGRGGRIAREGMYVW
jgi:hypothetical protein